MSNTQAALRAAKEVQADVLAPELYRQATEWFLKARQEYRYKDFEKAHNYAVRARQNAEQAELEALKNGGIRGGNPDTLVDEFPPPPPSDSGAEGPMGDGASPYDEPPSAGPPPLPEAQVPLPAQP